MKWLLAIAFCFFGCHHKQSSNIFFDRKIASKIYVQPFDDFPRSYSSYLVHELRKFCPEIILLDPVPLPKTAWYEPRKRFRADSLIG